MLEFFISVFDIWFIGTGAGGEHIEEKAGRIYMQSYKKRLFIFQRRYGENEAITEKITDSTFGNWVALKVASFSNNTFGPTYVGSWISSSWSNYSNERRYYATMVHYTDNSYSMPKSVQYYDVTLWYI